MLPLSFNELGMRSRWTHVSAKLACGGFVAKAAWESTTSQRINGEVVPPSEFLRILILIQWMSFPH